MGRLLLGVPPMLSHIFSRPWSVPPNFTKSHIYIKEGADNRASSQDYINPFTLCPFLTVSTNHSCCSHFTVVLPHVASIARKLSPSFRRLPCAPLRQLTERGQLTCHPFV